MSGASCSEAGHAARRASWRGSSTGATRSLLEAVPRSRRRAQIGRSSASALRYVAPAAPAGRPGAGSGGGMDYRLLGRTGLRVSPLCLGTMNFGMPDRPVARQADRRGRGVPDHGPRPRARSQLLRHRQRATATARGLTEEIIGRWFAQGGRREKVVIATKVFGATSGTEPAQPLAERGSAVGPAHPPGVRGQPAPAADRPHRPLPDAPRRPRHAVGGDLAGDGAAGRPGQGPLRRQQQLRRLAHRQGQRGRRPAPLARAGVGAEPLQPRRPHGRARGAAGVRRTTAWASSRGARWPAVSSAACSPTAPPVVAGAVSACSARSSATGRSSSRGRSSAPRSVRRRPTWRWRGCCTTRSSPRRSSGPRTVEQLDGAMGALDVRARRRRARRARPDLPRPGRRPRGLRLVAHGRVSAVVASDGRPAPPTTVAGHGDRGRRAARPSSPAGSRRRSTAPSSTSAVRPGGGRPTSST